MLIIFHMTEGKIIITKSVDLSIFLIVSSDFASQLCNAGAYTFRIAVSFW